MLGCQAIVDAHDGEAVLLREVLVPEIAHAGLAEDPAAAVEVQEESLCLARRTENAHRDFAGRAGDGRFFCEL